MINDNNEDVDDNVFTEELKASGKPPLWQMETLDQTIGDNVENLDMFTLNESDAFTQFCRNSIQVSKRLRFLFLRCYNVAVSIIRNTYIFNREKV